MPTEGRDHPHTSDERGAACLAPSLHEAAVDNCPMVEYLYDPPGITQSTTQSFFTEPLHIDADLLYPRHDVFRPRPGGRRRPPRRDGRRQLG